MKKMPFEADEFDRVEPEQVLAHLLPLHAIAASRGDGLHPKLLALAGRAATGVLTGSPETAVEQRRQAAGNDRGPLRSTTTPAGSPRARARERTRV